MITKLARLEFELFTKPSKSDFLRVHQSGYERPCLLCSEHVCTWSWKQTQFSRQIFN